MNSKESIDYTMKIRLFQTMVDNYSEEIALNYLSKADWDESKAAVLYQKENTENEDFKKVEQKSDIQENLLSQDNLKSNTTAPPSTKRGFFKQIVNKAISYICGSKREVGIEEEHILFSLLPHKVNSIVPFFSLIKTRIGIIFLYRGCDVPYIRALIKDIQRDADLIEMLRGNFAVYPVLSSTSEGSKVIEIVSSEVLYPAILFFSRIKQDASVLNKSLLIEKTEGSIPIDSFKNIVVRCLEYKSETYTCPILSNSQIIQNQKEEIAQLEKLEEEKKFKSQLEQKRAEMEEIEKKRKAEQLEERKKILLSKIPQEPDQDDPDSTLLIFRYPDGNRRIERRFLKSDKINLLYNYVESLGPEVFQDSEVESFDLIQPFPFKVYSDLEKTLEEEKLFPNAVMQIRELV